MAHRLEAYIADCCYGCDETRKLMSQLSAQFPELDVVVINLAEPGVKPPAAVFAVPTYLLDGKVLWMGNPRRGDAFQYISKFLKNKQNA